ncbi:MAG TPA: PQQ-binding-like beta-propeller repeat protein [Anaerolineales bacterium]|nr:PQQ-binding-like beta-propeller repeat protein [Anaerolineales bacterium]
MKDTLARLYDQYTGLVLVILAAVGIGLGGLAAFDPEQRRGGPAAAVTGTPAQPTATPGNIVVEVPGVTVTPAVVSEFGTIVAPASVRIFEDPAGFVSAPLGNGTAIYLTGAGGQLYAIDHLGGVRWSVELPGAPVGDLVLTPAGRLIAADRSGRLAAYDTNGGLVWEFHPGDGFGAVGGASIDSKGNLYYMLEAGGGGFLQSVSPGGTARWQAPVELSSYRVTPWVHPGEDLVFVKSAAYDLSTGSPVPLEFPFEVDAWITSADGSAFFQRGQTIAAWSIVDGSVTLPEDGPSFVIPDPGASIRQASIGLNGISWIAYIGQTTDGIAWYNPDGSLAHQTVTGSVSLSIVVAEDDLGVLYACGPSPREVSAEQLEQRSTFCLAFAPGEEKPLWQKPFAAAAQFFVGSFRRGAEVFIATEGGDLVVLGREEVTVQAVSEPTDAAEIPGGWYWRAPAPLVNYPVLLPDGTLPLLLEDGSVYFLAPDGSLSGSLQLSEFQRPDEFFELPVYFYENEIVIAVVADRVYAMQPGAGQLWEFPVSSALFSGDPFGGSVSLHHYSSGDVEFLWDSSLTLYAYTPQDGLLWQFTLEEGLRDDFAGPAVTDTGRLYIAGSEGTLYAFNADGPAWTFHPGGGLRAASDPRLGPDGNLYYVSTSGISGFLESVTPDGEHRWQTALDTFRYFNSPQFVSGGAYIRVADDFIDAATGVLVPIEFPFEVEDFIEGADGGNYIRTGSHIIRWEIGPEGYEQVRSYTVIMEGSNQFIQPIIRVYANGIIEVQIFDPNAPRYLWVDPDTGDIRSFERPWSVIGFSTGEIGPEFTHCEQDPEAQTLTCIKEVPSSPEPVWSLTIEGIDGGVSRFPPTVLYQDGRLYVVAGGVDVYMFEVEIP